jgi:hypothetical protein
MRASTSPRRRPVLLAACVTVSVVSVGALTVGDRALAQAQDEIADPPASWAPPVPGPVVRPFVAPIATYAAGHRGVDFAAAAGVPVRAANAGVVVFAGSVAGAWHVVIAHDGGVRTSYSFLASVEVHVGDHVARGTAVGTAGGSGDGHGAGVLHFGVRVGDRYVDPMLLFSPRDLTAMVRLVPADERAAAVAPDAGQEAAELGRLTVEEAHGCAGALGDAAAVIGLGDAVDSACDALEEALDTGWRALRALGDDVAAVVDRVAPIVALVVARMRATGEDLARAAAAVAGDAAEAVTAVVDTVVRYARRVYEDLTSCPQPRPLAHPKGSGNLVMAVAGLGSSRRLRRDGSMSSSFHFDAAVLGYRDGDVSFFSYRAGSITYSAPDTIGDLHAQARALGTQLQELRRAHPGRRVDLVAHSQGGVVVDLFLQEVYLGHETDYPAVANVVTFATPHEGTPLATLQTTVVQHPALARLARAVSHEPLGAPALAELQDTSPTISELRRRPFPRVRFLSIAGSEDIAVPSTSADPPIGRKIVVPAGDALVPDDHTAILADADALSAAQAQLAGGHPADTCGLLVDVEGDVVAGAAHAATAAVRTLDGATASNGATGAIAP